jgi:hypothetical protein
MHQHSSIWNIFFENIKNTVWCEISVGIINTYATILRWRVERFRKSKDERAYETLSHCERVLNLGGKLLKRYQTSLNHNQFLGIVLNNDSSNFYIYQKCAETLTYRYLVIKHNLLLQTGRGHNINPSEVRFLCKLELDPTCGATDKLGQSGNRLCGLMSHFGRPFTQRSLLITSDAEISDFYKFLAKKATKDMDYGADTVVPNRICGHCRYFEEEGNKMKRCSRCLIEFYCSSECQRSAWPDHQHVCDPAVTQNAATTGQRHAPH